MIAGRPTGTVLVADDDAAIRTVLNQALSRAGYDVRVTSNAASLWRWVAAGDGDLVISDVMMPDENAFDLLPRIREIRPDLPVVVMSAQNTFMTAIRASEAGAYEYLPKPFDSDRAYQYRRARALGTQAEACRGASRRAGENMPLVGRSPAMQEIYRLLARMMQTDLTVMVTGESGTGKELVARALHEYGRRRKGPFVAINMAAIPRDLIESELFGHEKGAFTGAQNRSSGRFEQANGGTLFLDEIGDMPMEAQTRLLRVLQQGEYMTVGGRTPIKTDVRIVAATNRDLRQIIAQGLLREDLYYRLNVVPLRLAAASRTKRGCPDLVRHFFKRAAERVARKAHYQCGSGDDAALSVAGQWCASLKISCAGLPRSIRRKKSRRKSSKPSSRPNWPSRTLLPLLAARWKISPFHKAVEQNMQRYFASFGPDLPPPGLYQRVLAEVEYPLISACLTATRGNQIKAADLLGLNRNTLRKKIRELGVNIYRGAKTGG